MLDTSRNYAILNLESYDCNARSKTNTFALDPLELILGICGVEDNAQKCVHNLQDLPQSEGAVGTIERSPYESQAKKRVSPKEKPCYVGAQPHHNSTRLQQHRATRRRRAFGIVRYLFRF